jgi:hypothetical protein
MDELIGWKRYEANSMMEFEDVSEENLNSIMRRSLAIFYHGRFMSKEYIEAHLPDAAEQGIFICDPSLKDKLKSGPVVGAFLKMLHAFWAKHSHQDCIDIIEYYATGGGDEGLTSKTIRSACGLEPVQTGTPETMDAVPQDDEITGDQHIPLVCIPPVSKPFESSIMHRLTQKSNRMIEFMLATGKDRLLAPHLRLITSISASEYDHILVELVKAGMWSKHQRPKSELEKKTNSISRRVKQTADLRVALSRSDEFYIPKIKFLESTSKLCDMTPRPTNVTFPETYNASVLDSLRGAASHMQHNHGIRRQVISRQIAMLKRPGMRSTVTASKIGALQEDMGKLDKKQNALDRIITKLSTTSVDSEDGLLKKITQQYSQRHNARSRCYAEGPGAQGLPGVILEFLCPHTEDHDMSNAMFTLLIQIVRRAKIQSNLAEAKFEKLAMVATDRDKMSREQLQVSYLANN